MLAGHKSNFKSAIGRIFDKTDISKQYSTTIQHPNQHPSIGISLSLPLSLSLSVSISFDFVSLSLSIYIYIPLAEPTLFGQNTRSTTGQCAALRREVVRQLGKRDAGAITCDVTQGELRDTAPRMPGVREPRLPLRPQEEKGRMAGPQNTCADTSAAENVSQAIGNTLQRSTRPLAEPTLRPEHQKHNGSARCSAKRGGEAPRKT